MVKEQNQTEQKSPSKLLLDVLFIYLFNDKFLVTKTMYCHWLYKYLSTKYYSQSHSQLSLKGGGGVWPDKKKCLKHFYGCNLRVSVISQGVYPFGVKSNVFESSETSFRWFPCLTHKHQTRLEGFARNEHSSLLRTFINYGRKQFCNIRPRKGMRV